ncbi:hypothetical protein EON64_19520 [archaeon]|nr:MAG: hypothetical protein EON64_19520 [archaeon]
MQGLLPEAEYEVTEPYPNNITQSSGTLMMVESEGEQACVWHSGNTLSNSFVTRCVHVVPVYQLGVPSMVMTGDILMHAGLPSKCP